MNEGILQSRILDFLLSEAIDLWDHFFYHKGRSGFAKGHKVTVIESSTPKLGYTCRYGRELR